MTPLPPWGPLLTMHKTVDELEKWPVPLLDIVKKNTTLTNAETLLVTSAPRNTPLPPNASCGYGNP